MRLRKEGRYLTFWRSVTSSIALSYTYKKEVIILFGGVILLESGFKSIRTSGQGGKINEADGGINITMRVREKWRLTRRSHLQAAGLSAESVEIILESCQNPQRI